MTSGRIAAKWVSGQNAGDPEWEEAYARFESGPEEVEKFLRRLRRFGAGAWSPDLQVVELFCGRGGALEAWRRLGFRRLEGVDLSESLLLRYAGEAALYLGDCRRLGLPDASRDVICVQGGLHHLAALPEDLAATVAEVRRVLRPGGRFLVVEPWSTPYLRAVHWACRQPPLRRLSPKLDALACMIDREKETYANWLSHPGEILAALGTGFSTELRQISRGKLLWLGRPASSGSPERNA